MLHQLQTVPTSLAAMVLSDKTHILVQYFDIDKHDVKQQVLTWDGWRSSSATIPECWRNFELSDLTNTAKIVADHMGVKKSLEQMQVSNPNTCTRQLTTCR